MKIYIAGPMRGYRDYNFPAFYIAEGMLAMRGHNVKNPARMDIEEGKAHWSLADGHIVLSPEFSINDALRRDFMAMCKDRETIVLLAGWEQSDGANEELRLARLIGLAEYLYTGGGEIEPLLPLDATAYPADKETP